MELGNLKTEFECCINTEKGFMFGAKNMGETPLLRVEPMEGQGEVDCFASL